jgi:hypothetical protein
LIKRYNHDKAIRNIPSTLTQEDKIQNKLAGKNRKIFSNLGEKNWY